jgi:cytochrome c oxidase subunit I+III
VGTAGFFLLLTVKLTIAALAFGVLALTMLLVWAWGTDRGPRLGPVEVAPDVRLPVYAQGRLSHGWWAMVVILLVLATTFGSLAFSHVYLALGAREAWPPRGTTLPGLTESTLAALAWLGASALGLAASRALARSAPQAMTALIVAGVGLMVGALTLDGLSHLRSGLAPAAHAYGATVATIWAVQATTATAVLVMAGYTVARAWRGLLTPVRRITLDNTLLLWHYTVGQGLTGLGMIQLVPRLLD